MGIIIHDAVTLNCGIIKTDLYATIHSDYKLTKNSNIEYKLTTVIYFYASQTPNMPSIQTENFTTTVSNLELDNIIDRIYTAIKQNYLNTTDT